jgi:hypothetical protein
LLELEITANEREKIVINIEPEDYFRGPVKSELNTNWSEYWEFGKQVKKKEVYIKIAIGGKNRQSLCISFHVAERKMQYLFKS